MPQENTPSHKFLTKIANYIFSLKQEEHEMYEFLVSCFVPGWRCPVYLLSKYATVVSQTRNYSAQKYQANVIKIV